MTNRKIILLVYMTALFINTYCLKLLLVFPVPAKSHYNLGNALGKGLALLGHEITIISAFEEKSPPKGYNEIALTEFVTKKDSEENQKKHNMFDMENINPYFQLVFLSAFGGTMTEMTFNHSKVQALVNSNQKFDAVIVEQFWNDGLKVFAHHFNAHLIAFSTIGPNRWINNLVANPENPSYIPDILLSFSSEISFFERAYNLIFGLVSDLVLYYYFYPSQESVLRKYFPNAPPLADIQTNISLVLTNSHESTNAAVPHVPNMIDIGGFHVSPPKELPRDLKEFMDTAKDGVIYFSLGSNLLPSQMPKDIKDIILKVLGSRKENILLKWDQDDLENKPCNVMISKWFPQQSILAHPKCKLFITHGGLLSLIETVSIGVPVLAFPVFGDQKLNAAKIKAKQIGLSLVFSQITEENLRDALNDLLDNPLYKENAQRSSRIMHDRAIKPIELADYWIKYVVRYGGAPHLRVAGINLPLYKYYNLDVFAVIFGVLFLTAYFLKISFRLCFKRADEPKLKTKRE